MNIKMWWKALNIIPRVNKAQWKKLDIVSKFLIMTRSAVFVMTIMAGIVGGLLAYKAGYFNGVNFLVCLLGLIFAHASNNLINDLTDFIKKVDDDNYYRTQYGPQPLVSGLMSLSVFYRYIAFSLVIAILCGVYLIVNSGIETFYFALAGLFFILFYTWPLKYIGLGEVAVLIVWGPLMIIGSYFVVSLDHQFLHFTDLLLIALIYALGPTNVLLGKHIDKLTQDAKKGVNTLPVIIGEKSSRILVQSLWVIQYLLVIVLMMGGYFGFSFLLVFITLPTFIKAFKLYLQKKPDQEPDDYPENVWPLYFSAISFDMTRKFGSWFLLALLIDVLI